MTPFTLYLCQHGEAVAKDVDPDRPLSDQGTTDVCNVANVLGGKVEPRAIVHSGKTRARQTAELLHERLAPAAAIGAEPGLGPKDPVEEYADTLQNLDGDTMVVGHMPFVDGLASYLLGRPGMQTVAFEPGTVAALTRSESGEWLIAWILTPALAAG